MDQESSAPAVSRKEARKQKLMEYLVAKGKLKLPDPRPSAHGDGNRKGSVISGLKIIKGKENEAPQERLKVCAPKTRSLPAQSRRDSVRTVLGVNRAAVKNAAPTTQNDGHRPASGSCQTQLKPKLNSVLTSTYSVLSSSSNLDPARHLKRKPQTNQPVQTSSRCSASAAPSDGTKINKFSIRSKVPPTNPMKTVSLRMSLGPMVKTRTGLIPAVTQPKHTQSNPQLSLSSSVTHGKPATTAKVSTKPYSQGKLQPSSFQSVKSVISTAKHRDVAHGKVKLGCKPQPSHKSHLSIGLNSTSASVSVAAPYKPQAKVSTGKKTACQPACRAQQLQSGAVGKGNNSVLSGVSKTVSRPVSRPSTSTVSVRAQPLMGPGAKKSQESEFKIKNRSGNIPQLQTLKNKPRAPGVAWTAPQLTRTIVLTSQATEPRTKATVKVVPQTEEKKLTKAQEERLRKLHEWREAKGITYKRPPMPVKPQVRRTVSVPNPYWESMKQEDEAHSLISAVDRSLADCIKLLEEGCPSDSIRGVLSRLPDLAKKFAKYWICQARLMEREDNLDVLPMFEEAVRLVVEPVDELRTVVFEILKKKDEIQVSDDCDQEKDDIPSAENSPESSDLMMTPKPVRALIWGRKGDSSLVKYKITATPGGPQSQKKEPPRVNGHEVRFFTPVRRSVRIERAAIKYPPSLQDHDLCVTSYNELLSEEDAEKQSEESSPRAEDTPMYIYRENEALKDQVIIQLLSD